MFKITPAQYKALGLITNTDLKHILLYGGSRSGKTAIITRTLLIRASKEKKPSCLL